MVYPLLLVHVSAVELCIFYFLLRLFHSCLHHYVDLFQSILKIQHALCLVSDVKYIFLSLSEQLYSIRKVSFQYFIVICYFLSSLSYNSLYIFELLLTLSAQFTKIVDFSFDLFQIRILLIDGCKCRFSYLHGYLGKRSPVHGFVSRMIENTHLTVIYQICLNFALKAGTL